MSDCRSCSGKLSRQRWTSSGKTVFTKLVTWSLDQACLTASRLQRTAASGVCVCYGDYMMLLFVAFLYVVLCRYTSAHSMRRSTWTQTYLALTASQECPAYSGRTFLKMLVVFPTLENFLPRIITWASCFLKGTHCLLLNCVCLLSCRKFFSVIGCLELFYLKI